MDRYFGTAAAALLLAGAGLGWGLTSRGAPPQARAALSLEDGFRNPPPTARPAIYYLLLNGYVNLGYVDRELEEFQKAGIGGLCVFDMGARGDASARPPAGPAFLSPESVKALGLIIRTAGRLGMEVDLSVTSSWDMGGSWVEPRDASMTLVSSEIDLQGPSEFDDPLPFPAVLAETPKRPDGMPVFHHEVAVLAIPEPERRTGHEFLFELPGRLTREVNRVVVYNTESGDPATGREHLFARDFVVSVSDTSTQGGRFREVLRGSLAAREGAQDFRFPPARAKYVRLEIRSGHNPRFERVQLGEFEVYAPDGTNVLLSHRANRYIDGARLIRFTSAHGQIGAWSAENIHDGIRSGARGSWSSAGRPPLSVRDSRSVIDLSSRIDISGKLRWSVPAGKWTLLRFICTNTGERLKVPSPNSDGLATDHLSATATKRYIQEVIARLKPEIGDFRKSALKELYLASYEVRGQIWTPDFLDQFKRRRGYDFKPYLPILSGGVVDNEEITERVRYDFQKTLGEVMVDAYYRAAGEVAHASGLEIESEAGGPGPPIHQVPVDALQALGAVDAVRGEFWPFRPDARAMWVVKETASAAHIYGKKRVHMESFTSNMHWQESPQELKASADRAFCEGMNQVVWHTASHQPPESGKPGWVYYAGTHLTPNSVWWPMAKPFLDYLARCSFLLQQGLFAGDVVYYYGDQGFNFVMPKEVDPALGFGYDYDVTNAEVILTRMSVREGKIVLPDGMSYEVLVLPERADIDLSVLRRIGELVSAGATILGPKPERATGFSGYPQRDRQVQELADKIWGPCDGQAARRRKFGEGTVICGSTLREVLKERGIGPDFAFESPFNDTELDFIHRRTPDAEIYFVRNKKRRWEEVAATFRVRGLQPEIWLPDTGEIRRCLVYSRVPGGTQVPLRLAPEGSLFLVFRKADTEHGIVSVRSSRSESRPAPDGIDPFPALDWMTGGQTDPVAFQPGSYELRGMNGSRHRVEIPALPSALEIGGPWSLTFAEGWGAPATAVFPRLISWTEHKDPGVRYFSGIADYRTEVTLENDWLSPKRRVILDLGHLWAVAEVRFNGRSAGVLWKQPFRVDVTPAARPGKNELVVRIANTWANRLIGDALNPSGQRYTRTNVTTTTPAGIPWASVELISSGLFGPVRLRAGLTVSLPVELIR